MHIITRILIHSSFLYWISCSQHAGCPHHIKVWAGLHCSIISSTYQQNRTTNSANKNLEYVLISIIILMTWGQTWKQTNQWPRNLLEFGKRRIQRICTPECEAFCHIFFFRLCFASFLSAIFSTCFFRTLHRCVSVLPFLLVSFGKIIIKTAVVTAISNRIAKRQTQRPAIINVIIICFSQEHTLYLHHCT